MSLIPSTRIEFECATCGAESVDSSDRLAECRRELGVPFCQLCEDKAEGWAIGVVMDSVLMQPNRVVHPSTRTVIDFGVIEEFHPPVEYATAYERWLMLILGLLTIAVGVAVADWWVG